MKILRYIKAALILGPVLVYCDLVYFIRYARHPEKYPIEVRYSKVRWIITFCLKLFNVDYKIKGIEKFYSLKSKALILSNHLSLADPLILIANSEKPITFVAKDEVKKSLFIGTIAKAIDVFFLDRKNLIKQVEQIKSISSYLADPEKPNIIIYIEGTRNKHPENECLNFHPGTLKIAQMSNVPILTGATFGTHRVFALNSYLKRVQTQFTFINQYDFDFVKNQNTNEFAATLKKEIDAAVDEQRKVDLAYLNDLKLSKRKYSLESVCDTRVKS